MTCNLCTRAQAAACVGVDLCHSLHLTDEEACRLAAEACLSWWQKRDEMAEVDDVRPAQRIDRAACALDEPRQIHFLREHEVVLV